jgi:phage/conjugal plasmid C-4 type zinc finger TraR family protein
MADRTGIATKLARVLGGRGPRGAAETPSSGARRTGASTAKAGGAAAEADGDTVRKSSSKATAKTQATSKAQPAAKTQPAKKIPAKKVAAKTAAPAKKVAAKKTVAAKTAAAAKAPTRAASTRAASTKAAAGTKTATAAKAAARGAGPTRKATTQHMTTTATKVTAKGSPAAGDIDYGDIRAALGARLAELRGEHDRAVSDINDLQRDRVADGAGDDQADAGTKTFEREQEISLANGILDRLTQVERALDRLDAGTYGHCERCGNPIPQARLEAFPSVTLCVTCKQIEERR